MEKKEKKPLPVSITELQKALEGWKYLTKLQRAFLIQRRLTDTEREACKIVGIHKATPFKWRKDPAFVELENFFMLAPMYLALGYTDELFIEAIGVLHKILTDNDAPPRVRVDAASKAIQLALDLRAHTKEAQEVRISLSKGMSHEQGD